MNWYLITGLILLACLAFAGWACCNVGGDAERRWEIQRARDEHEDGLPL